jgi:hypothetical protein
MTIEQHKMKGRLEAKLADLHLKPSRAFATSSTWVALIS